MLTAFLVNVFLLSPLIAQSKGRWDEVVDETTTAIFLQDCKLHGPCQPAAMTMAVSLCT